MAAPLRADTKLRSERSRDKQTGTGNYKGCGGFLFVFIKRDLLIDYAGKSLDTNGLTTWTFKTFFIGALCVITVTCLSFPISPNIHGLNSSMNVNFLCQV